MQHRGSCVSTCSDLLVLGISRPQIVASVTVRFSGGSSLSDHYGFGIDAVRVREARDKGIVENSVGIAQDSILAPLRNRRFFSLAELNAALREKLDEVNDRPMSGHHGESRNDRHARLDAPGYMRLPPRRYEFGSWQLGLRAGQDYYVFVEGNRYSVPSRLIGECVDVKTTAHSVHIFHLGQSLWTHRRARGTGQIVTEPTHMPENHRQAAMLRLSGMKAYVRDIGPEAQALIEAHYRRGRKPQCTSQEATKLVILAKECGIARVQAACAKALALDKASVTKVEDLLKAGLESFAPNAPETEVTVAPSGNVRGADYFALRLGIPFEEENNE